MSGWSPFLGLKYPEYMLANSYVRDVTGAITVSNKSLQNKISSFTTEVVASQQALAQNFQYGYDQLNNTLSWGINRLSDNLQDISWAIEDLRVDFTYNMGLILFELQSQNKMLKSIIDKLDEINETLKHPVLTQAREYYFMGEERLKKHLIQKALEAFIKANELNDTDFIIENQLGNIYLFGIDDEVILVDLNKAKKHFLAAAKYALAETKSSAFLTKIAAESYLKASFSVYFQLNAELLKSEPQISKQLLIEAKELATKAVKINNELQEASYHICKYDALLGNTADSLSLLDKLINQEPKYAIKAVHDDAFNLMRPDLEILINKKKDIKFDEYSSGIERFRTFISNASKFIKKEIVSLEVRYMWPNIESDLNSIITTGSKNTFFDYISALEKILILDANIKIFKSKLISCYHDFIYNLHKKLDSYQNSIHRAAGFPEVLKESLISQLRNLMYNIKNDEYYKLLYKYCNSMETYWSLDFINADKLNALQLLFKEGDNLSIKINQLLTSADLAKSQIAEEDFKKKQIANKKLLVLEEKKLQRANNRASNGLEYAMRGAVFFGIIGFLFGCVKCSQDIVQVEAHRTDITAFYFQ